MLCNIFLKERKFYFTVKLSKCFKHQDCGKAVFIFLFFGLQIGSGSNKSVRNMWRFSELFKLHRFVSGSAQPFPLSFICKDHRMGICSLSPSKIRTNFLPPSPQYFLFFPLWLRDYQGEEAQSIKLGGPVSWLSFIQTYKHWILLILLPFLWGKFPYCLLTMSFWSWVHS